MQNISAKNHELIKHSSAIHVSNTVNVIERKISNILLKNAFINLLSHEKYCMRIQEIMKLLGWQSNDNYELIKKSLKKLNITQLEWNILGKDKKNEWGISTVISGVRIKDGVCEYSYSPMLRELLASPNIYAKLNLAVQAKFGSKYSLALWEFCIETLCCSNKEDYVMTDLIKLADLKRILGVPEGGANEEFKILNRDVIKRAIKEINEVSDITIESKVEKLGKTVVAISFLICKKSSWSTAIEVPYRSFEADSISSGKGDAEEDKKTVIKRLKEDFNLSADLIDKLVDSYPLDKIMHTIDHIKSNKAKIRDLTAYLRIALREGWHFNGSQGADKKIKTPSAAEIEKELKRYSPLWRKILADLIKRFDYFAYRNWFSKLEFLGLQEGGETLTLKAPTGFIRDWTNDNFKTSILEIAIKHEPSIREINLII